MADIYGRRCPIAEPDLGQRLIFRESFIVLSNVRPTFLTLDVAKRSIAAVASSVRDSFCPMRFLFRPSARFATTVNRNFRHARRFIVHVISKRRTTN